MNTSSLAGGLEGLIRSVPRDRLISEAVLLGLLFAKAEEMDPAIGAQRVRPKPKPKPEPRREFDPEAYDSEGRFVPRYRRPSVRGRQAQGLVEYALVLALVAIVAIVALLYLGGQVSAILSSLGGSI